MYVTKKYYVQQNYGFIDLRDWYELLLLNWHIQKKTVYVHKTIYLYRYFGDHP